METLIPYLLPLLLLPLSLHLIFSILKNPKNLPPGSMGYPFLGENMALATSGSQKLVRDRMHKFSRDAFKTSLLGENMAVLCGAEGNKLVFKNQNNLFRRWAPPSLVNAMFQGLDRARRQEPKAAFDNFQYEALKPNSLKRYVPVMDSLAREHLEAEWRGSVVVEALPSSRRYALSLACRVFMSASDWEGFLEPLSLVTKGLLSMPVSYLPWTASARAMKGGRVVRRELLRIVGERRAAERKGEDLLSKMVAARNEEGECVSDGMVVNVMIGLLVAAEYEVSSFITNVIYHLAGHPHVYDRVLEGACLPDF